MSDKTTSGLTPAAPEPPAPIRTQIQSWIADFIQQLVEQETRELQQRHEKLEWENEQLRLQCARSQQLGLQWQRDCDHWRVKYQNLLKLIRQKKRQRQEQQQSLNSPHDRNQRKVVHNEPQDDIVVCSSSADTTMTHPGGPPPPLPFSSSMSPDRTVLPADMLMAPHSDASDSPVIILDNENHQPYPARSTHAVTAKIRQLEQHEQPTQLPGTPQLPRSRSKIMDDEWTKMEQHKITKEIPPTSYKYRETVRGKEARKAMHGKDCPCCADYHRVIAQDLAHSPPVPSQLNAAQQQALQQLRSEQPAKTREERVQALSKHRDLYKAPETPSGYWSVGFDEEVKEGDAAVKSSPPARDVHGKQPLKKPKSKRSMY